MDLKQFAKNATPVFSDLCWGGLGLLSAYLMYALADAWLIAHVGSGAPWWAYALLSVRLVGGIAHMAANDAALRTESAAPSPVHPGEAGTAETKPVRSPGNSDFLPN